MCQRMCVTAVLMLAVCLSGGCRHCCRRPPATPVPFVPARPGCPTCPNNCPPPGAVQPQPPAPEPPPPSPPPGPGARGQEPEEAYAWRPSPDATVRPPSAQLPRGDAQPDGARLYPPEPPQKEPPPLDVPKPGPTTQEPPVAERPPETKQPAEIPMTPPLTVPPVPPAKPETKEPPEAPALPVDIPQFAAVKRDVAAGLKPFPDGFDWLKANGYRTVLHLRAPGEDDSADRKQVEKRGLKYESLEVSPATLNKDLVDRFNALVGNEAALPVFVYDKDGLLTGTMFYLNFRLAEGVGDVEARKRAARLGLKSDAEGEHKAMWVAIQKVLAGTGVRD